ncbi:dihydroxyacetone kinase subunit DhaK [Barrientosiimonas marina]|uniref:Dihydroxyacetone kinase subunit DhaK n=1 Tax=Lentibacillus kimchii TaxID=1542911 RepID=A0ABW2UX14_9BACI
MKKIINDPNAVVQEMAEGLAAAYPDDLEQLPGTTVIKRRTAPESNKVGIVSGGGSGHEPAHAGYVGKGMLDAAVAGEVFTSPTPDQIFEAIKAVDGGAGVFMVVKNYTGDVLNFDMAAELAEAENIKVAKVVVNDDVAVDDVASRRGIAGTILVHKMAGAKAEQGGSLEEVKAAADKAAENVRSVGMALTPCTVPAAGTPSFTLAENEMEIGIGIHGEPGIERKEIAPADDIAQELTDKLLADYDFSGSDTAVIVNGLGSTPEMELYIMNNKVQAILANNEINVYKTLVGEYMTSLEMTGCSLTLLQLDDELKQLLDEPANTLAFNG